MWSPQSSPALPSPAQPLHSAPQVIEKMEVVLKNKLQERSKTLPSRLQGKPSRGELLPRSHPCPGVPPFPELPSSRSSSQLWQMVVLPLHSLLSENPWDILGHSV